jgi:hypothetical protein
MTDKKKRVNYSWLKTRMGRTAKAYIAVLVEDTDWMPVFKKETTRNGIFTERILVRFNKAFPNDV